jgi:predicted membrane metal-binding protein
LVIGDQRAVNQSDWKIFNRTGIGHLISISGLRKSNDALCCRGKYSRNVHARLHFPPTLGLLKES